MNLDALMGHIIIGWLVVLVGGYLLLGFNIAKRSDVVRTKVRRIGVAMALYVIGLVLLRDMRYSVNEAAVFSALGALAVSLLLVPPAQRSRRISASVRRQVIKRDLGDDEYDPKKHHIDHIVPFSKGGDNSPENLRVLDKKDNLRRGAKMPKLRDFYR